MNYAILIAVLAQALITRVSRIAGAVVGFLVTTGILVWGLGAYSGGGNITFFGMKLSLPVFLLVCLVWYGFDVNALVQARKHQAFQSRLPAATPPAASTKESPEPAQVVTGTEGAVPIVISWAGMGMAADVDVYVTLDGAPAGSGTFINGFVLNLTTTEGIHEIGVKAGFRKTSVTLTTEANKSYRVDLRYSRVSGKFKLESSETSAGIG